MDKKDMFAFFRSFMKKDDVTEMSVLFDTYELSKLDINRITRYLDKHSTEQKSALCEDIDFDCVDMDIDINE